MTEPIVPNAPIMSLDTTGTETIAPATSGDPWDRRALLRSGSRKTSRCARVARDIRDAILDVVRFRDETTIHIPGPRLREVCAFLRDHPELSFNFLTDVTAVDMLRLRSEPRFDVVAHALFDHQPHPAPHQSRHERW